VAECSRLQEEVVQHVLRVPVGQDCLRRRLRAPRERVVMLVHLHADQR
jgi:hypothetical protein